MNKLQSTANVPKTKIVIGKTLASGKTGVVTAAELKTIV